MGTEITLEVGGLTIDWCKNSRGVDHGMLFQDKDRMHIRSEQINYDYFNENDEDPGPMEMAFSRSLKETVPRIELLGFTIDQVHREYKNIAEAWIEESRSMEDEDGGDVPELMNFEEFCSFVAEHPVEMLDDTYIPSLGEEREAKIRGRFNDKALVQRLPYFREYDMQAYSELSYFGGLLSFLHPYSILLLLSQTDRNLELGVVWQYGPLVEAGWASESEFVCGARRTQTFLVATEGSSDAHVLDHALSILRPDISDFFRFIDMTDGHPFPGTGNLVKFAKGLVKIDVQNNMIFLLDNDAEGVYAYQKLQLMNMPPNMRAMMLPNLEEFTTFNTRGPEGVFAADINGRAAAIECYLDLNLNGYPPASVVWTNYKKDLDIYHGSLEHKESYTKNFLKQTSDTVSVEGYRVDKMHLVLNALINECCEVAKSA